MYNTHHNQMVAFACMSEFAVMIMQYNHDVTKALVKSK